MRKLQSISSLTFEGENFTGVPCINLRHPAIDRFRISDGQKGFIQKLFQNIQNDY